MISIDAKNLEYAQRRLGGAPKQIEQAAANAINYTITKIKTQTSKSIRKNYLVSAKNINLIIVNRSNLFVNMGINSTFVPKITIKFD